MNTISRIDKSIVRSIRNKKTSNKASDVFSCLTSPIELPKAKPVKVKKITNDTKHGRAVDGLRSIKRVYETRKTQGGKFKTRSARLYIKYATILGEPIPEEVLLIVKNRKCLNYEHGKRKQQRHSNRVPRKYSKYIESRFWEERKNRYYQTHIRRCAICGSYDKISIHHLNYNNKEFGNEKDDDLVALCWSCHKEFHDEYGVKKNSHKDFAIFASSKINNPFVD